MSVPSTRKKSASATGRRGDNSRERLLAAALAAFSEHGYYGTTTRDIAKRAGLSGAALYVHYDSKDELLYLVASASHEQLLEELRQRSDAASPTDRLRELMRAHVTFHATHPAEARVANYEISALKPKYKKRIVALRTEAEQLFENALSDGEKTGELQVRDLRAATVLIAAIGIEVARWFKAGGRLTAAELADLYAEMVLDMFSVGRDPAGSRRA